MKKMKVKISWHWPFKKIVFFFLLSTSWDAEKSKIFNTFKKKYNCVGILVEMVTQRIFVEFCIGSTGMYFEAPLCEECKGSLYILSEDFFSMIHMYQHFWLINLVPEPILEGPILEGPILEWTDPRMDRS